MDELIDVAVVGQPVVYGAGFVALLLILLTGPWALSVVTVAHEGGHMIMAVLTLRGFSRFTIDEKAGGETKINDGSWGVGDFLQTIAGFLSPPLLGLGGAAVLSDGNAWGVLVATAVLLFAAFLYASEGLANLVTAIALVVVILVLWRGTPLIQLTLAALAVWLLLIGGVYQTLRMSRAKKTDAWWMARRTLVPAIVWQGFWFTVALVSLYAGARLLFVGDAWPDGVWPFDERA